MIVEGYYGFRGHPFSGQPDYYLWIQVIDTRIWAMHLTTLDGVIGRPVGGWRGHVLPAAWQPVYPMHADLLMDIGL